MMKKQLLFFSVVLFTGSVMAQEKDQPPPPPPSVAIKAPPPPPALPSKDYEHFLKRHPLVQSVGWSANGRKVHIHLKSGKEEVYNLDVDSEAKELVRKYDLPPVPPPPPPAPKVS